MVISVVKMFAARLVVDPAADRHDDDLDNAVVRLSLVWHPPPTPPADSAQLAELLDGIDHCLLIRRCAAGL